MALNPVLKRNGEPEIYDDAELFLIRRDRIQFSVKEPKIGKFSAKGSLYLTTESLFFVAANPKVQNNCEFSSFRIPLTKMYKEKFNQPIFGANNLAGKVPPVGDENLLNQLGVADFKFRFTFNEGGCGTFLPIFFRIMGAVREFGDQAAQHVAPQVLSGSFAAAYVDPSDPSTIYVSQPAHARSNPAAMPPPQSQVRGATPVASRSSFVSQQPAADTDPGSYLV